MFDYGNIPDKDPHFKECLEREFFERSQYEKFVKVKEGDVVVDIGASIGPFLYSIKDRKNLKVIAVEPMPAYHDLLLKNSFSPNILDFNLYKNAIGSTDNEVLDLEWSSERELVTTISFDTIIRENNLTHINFLKLDCEGGEYSIFTEKHIDYLKHNVDYITGEFHLNTQEMKNSFIKMYNLLKEKNFNFIIESVDGRNISQSAIDNLDAFSQYYSQVILYIDNRSIKKVLFIAPHLSTGGLPQYLVKKIELLRNELEVYVVEWVDCTGGVLVVQRDKVVNLVDSDKFFTLKQNKTELFDIINQVKPDVVHLEEIPEYFMDNSIAQQLYNPNREYFIVETSHDSSFDTDQKRFFPDKFMFVSNWQIQQYKNIDIPKVLVEYPIEYVERPDRTQALEELGLDPNKKHILHVGLFTPRKNQAEFFEYAKSLPDYEFHCLGNQADNFKYYWEPLMDDKPSNLTWWNERTDVDRFYKAMDLFLFTSRGTNNDKETMPLVIREALSHQIPILIYNLPVYLNYFDKFEGIRYLNFDNFESNCELIKDTFGDKFALKPENEVFIISTYPSTDSAITTTLDCVKAVQKHGYKVILTSHIPIPDILQQQADYCVVDKNNVLTKHTFYSSFSWSSDLYDAFINLKGEDNDVYHGPAVYTNYYNGAALATQLEFKKAYFLNYDYILKDVRGIKNISKILDKTDFYFGKHHPAEGDALYTYFFAAKPYSLNIWLESISTGKEYDQLMETYSAESNGLENLFHHIFKNGGAIYREEESVFDSKSKEIFDHKDFSRVEYFSILPSNLTGYFSPFIYISNSKDSRVIDYKVYKNNKLIIERTLNVDQKFLFWDMLYFNQNDTYKIDFSITDTSGLSELKTFTVDQDYYNNLSNNGKFIWKGDTSQYITKPQIKIYHLLTHPEDEREQRSIKSISKLAEYDGVEYTQVINAPYTDLPPVETCNRPNDVQMEPGYYKLAPGHYGCFKAHTDAILSCPKDENVVYLFFECDAILLKSTEGNVQENFLEKLYKAIELAKHHNYTFFSFAHNYEVFNEYETHIDAGMFTDAHAYMIMGSKIDQVHEVINNSKWDAFDLWVTNNFRQEPKGFYREPLAFQAKGYSLIDRKISETNIKGDLKV